jgi:hypothetical protein
MTVRCPDHLSPWVERGTKGAAWPLVALSICLAGTAAAEEIEVSFAYVAAPDLERVTIEQPLGRLDLHGWDEQKVRIVAKKHALDARTLNRLRVRVEIRDGHALIRTGTLVGDVVRFLPSNIPGGAGIDLTIDAPRTVRLRATTFSGDLKTSGFRHGAELASSGGEVRASDISGPVHSSALKGQQHLSEIRGDIEADGVSGDLELEKVDGGVLSARLVDGTITAHRVQTTAMSLVSATGSIFFMGELRKGGRYQFFTQEGDIRIELPHAPFSVSARASGEVRSGFPLDLGKRTQAHCLFGRYLGGGPSLEVSAEQGEVAITPAADFTAGAARSP